MPEQWPNEPPEGPGPWWVGCLPGLVLVLVILAVWAIYRYLM